MCHVALSTIQCQTTWTDRRWISILCFYTITFVSYWSTLVIQTVACFEVIYVRPTVNTIFIDKHCCSSVLMLHPYRLEQSSHICTHCRQFR